MFALFFSKCPGSEVLLQWQRTRLPTFRDEANESSGASCHGE
jgi:hypothetical protein